MKLFHIDFQSQKDIMKEKTFSTYGFTFLAMDFPASGKYQICQGGNYLKMPCKVMRLFQNLFTGLN